MSGQGGWDAVIEAALASARGRPEDADRMADQPDQPPAWDLPTAAQLKSKAIPALRMFVNGLVAEGLTVLAGSPKIGKSWLALDLALCVADGTRFLGARTRQCGVVYCALEDSERRLQDRIRLILGSAPQWPERFRYLTKLPSSLVRQHLVGMCDALIDQHPDTGLVVFDTLGRVKPPQRAGANQYD
ncbi:MAG: helicase RepA family protein, partial [Bifidobacteriaceae bacterium]|nr:helicase RepA family protein [Bifidobacteriaceae bacterium]